MMMSLFSSFDALCAESIGQKVSLSWAPAVNTIAKDAKQQQGCPAVVVSDRKAGSIDAVNKGKEGSSSTLPRDAKKPRDHHQLQQKRRPRFAVELDGVHCFETIIPY